MNNTSDRKGHYFLAIFSHLLVNYVLLQSGLIPIHVNGIPLTFDKYVSVAFVISLVSVTIGFIAYEWAFRKDTLRHYLTAMILASLAYLLGWIVVVIFLISFAEYASLVTVYSNPIFLVSICGMSVLSALLTMGVISTRN